MTGIGNQGQGGVTPPVPNLDGVEDIVDATEPGVPATAAPPVAPSVNPETPAVPGTPASVSFTPRTDDLLGDPDVVDPNKPVVTPTEDKDPNEDPNEGGDPDASPEEAFYSGVVNILKKKDFFQQDDIGEIKTDVDLAAVLDKEIEARLTDRYKELDALAKSGAPVDKVVGLQRGLEQLGQITESVIEESPEIAEQLIVEDFVHKGFSQEDAVKYFGLISQAGNSTEEAVKALAARKIQFTNAITDVKTKAKEANDAITAQRAKAAKELSDAFEANKILGRDVGPSTRERLKKLVNTPVAYTSDGQPLNKLMKFKVDNPVEFEQKLSYLFLVTDGFKDLKSFDRSAETRVSRSMRDAVDVLSTDGGPIARATASGKNIIDINSIDDVV